MEIDRPHAARPRPFPLKPAAPRQDAGVDPLERRDLIDLSAAAQRLRAPDADADARAARVRALREQVDSGRYEVDPHGIARKMMERDPL